MATSAGPVTRGDRERVESSIDWRGRLARGSVVSRIPLIKPAIPFTVGVTPGNEDRVIAGKPENRSIVAPFPPDERGSIKSVKVAAPVAKRLVGVVV